MISDDDLLLYHYQDGLEPAERARIAAALATEPELAARLKNLTTQLDAAKAVDVEAPAASLRRWKTDLDRAARLEQSTEKTPPFHWRMGLAAAVVMALAVTFGVRLNQTPDVSIAPVASAEGEHDDTARYARGLRWHLAQTELQLASLNGMDREDRARAVNKLIEQNRLYALAAERAKEEQLARVLRAFNPVLAGLADRQIDAAELNGAIAQLNFELKVMQARLATASGASTTWPGIPLAQ